MSYRTHCDWCGEHLAYESDQAVMPVTIYHRKNKSTLDGKWAEETGVTRHFCAWPKRGSEADSPDRRPSCYERAVEAIKGTTLTAPSMGMEWRLVPVSCDGAGAPALDPDDAVELAGTKVTRELYDALVARLPVAKHELLPAASIVSLDQIAVMTDGELLAIDGIGRRTLEQLREAVAGRERCDGLTLARKVFALLQAGLERVGEEDPMHTVLAGALPPLAAALAQPQQG